MKITPANNVTAGAFGAFITVLVLHLCAANNIIVPPDVAEVLPPAFAVAIAHIYDMLTGGNKPPEQQVAQNVQAQMKQV